MKRLLLSLCALTFPLAAAPLTQSERDALVAQLDKSAKVFLGSLEGVSQTQWNYKPAVDRWSIAECAEHVVTADQMMFAFAVQMVKMPPPVNPERASDESVVESAVDRSAKVKTAEFLEPKGRYASRDAVVQAFHESRAKIIEYVKTSQDDMRSHGFQGPAGYRDAYQFLLSISAHAERHSQQIAEVKADRGYPKK